ncbi:hypothetical protein [Deinococcus aquiradiocola]|uniref:Uncharacterized protein n=1 Tax=Deinococcus aquiradiocola TaxID=393059 RepID=A0A917P7G8_9DEIO|nr:hypothetical protein [Deinococcus aquiradiocola]GGJ65345.1 hypothetical protein GCM10008939_06590 [Deinococcus aquiradiocola]
MVFTPKNPGVTTSSTIQPSGAIAYWRTNPQPGDAMTDLGYIVVSNRNKNQTTFDVNGNRTGTEVLLKRIVKSSSETITFYSKNNSDSDILALHSGTSAVVGSSGTGITGVTGFTDTAAPANGDFVLVGQSPDASALVQVAWFPYAQLSGSGEATEDILRYPQFDVTNLAWASNFSTVIDSKLAPYVTSSSAVKVVFLVPQAQLDAVLTAIQGTSAAPAFQTSHAYALNDIVRPTTANGFTYKATTAGTSASTEPTWPTAANSTVTSGTATFTRQ